MASKPKVPGWDSRFVVYCDSPEQKQRLENAARAEKRSLSNFALMASLDRVSKDNKNDGSPRPPPAAPIPNATATTASGDRPHGGSGLNTDTEDDEVLDYLLALLPRLIARRRPIRLPSKSGQDRGEQASG